ncbi:hypothetical protein C8R47DRAFT_1172958 [Mycena vitilis]|nr:hypothetical protein C8R47DRAFT_1172958 [Mycena vitilis]
MASEHYLAVLKVSCDYDPDPGADEEITIKEGQLLVLKECIDSDWWRVKIKGDSHWQDDSALVLVPAAYVERADHTSVVKALYDYEARATDELSIAEGQILLVFDKEGERLLVQTHEDGGKAGFVPANYVEPRCDDEGAPVSQIVASNSMRVRVPIPAAPHLIAPHSLKPANAVAHVASLKIKSDDMEVWPVSEVDRKGKKKKGTLGVGNGVVFFASTSAPHIFRIFAYAPKTLVQKWQTVHIQKIAVNKSKHLHIDVGGPNAVNLHFSVGSKDNADAIAAKLESSKQLSFIAGQSTSNASLSTKPVVFNALDLYLLDCLSSPANIVRPPDPESPDYIDAKQLQMGVDRPKYARAPQDVPSDDLLVAHWAADEWWKVRNAEGQVVPALYIEASCCSSSLGVNTNPFARVAHLPPLPHSKRLKAANRSLLRQENIATSISAALST